MSDEDAYVEFQRICEIVEKRFGIKMEQREAVARYTTNTFWIIAHFTNTRKGKKSFEIEIARHDIQEADKNAAIKGAQPLPPNDGIENL